MKNKTFMLIVVLCVCTVLAGAMGYAMGQKNETSESVQKLKFSVVPTEEIGFIKIPEEKKGEGYSNLPWVNSVGAPGFVGGFAECTISRAGSSWSLQCRDFVVENGLL